MEFYLAQIILFAGNFTIRGMSLCWGQIMAISQNAALFSLVGTTYGGNGTTTFQLPDLRGRTAVGWGNSPNLGNFDIGQIGGTTTTTLTINNMPSHTHGSDVTTLTSIPSASTAVATTNIPGSTLVPAQLPKLGSGPTAQTINGYAAQDNSTTLATGKVGGSVNILPSGGNQAFSIQNPYLAMSYLITLTGVFPSRN